MCTHLFLQLQEKLHLHHLPLLTFFLSLFFLYKWLRKSNHTNQKNPPPSPPKLPILGNLHQLGECSHRALRSLSQKYGELMLLHLGSTPTLVVSSANAAQEIMKTHDLIFSNRPTSSMANIFLYNGKDVAFAKYGEYWRQMKSICVVQLLGNTRVRSFRKIREEETKLMIEKIKRSTYTPPTNSINLTEIMATLTHNVVCKAAFGRKYNREERHTNDYKVLRKFVELLGVFCVGDFIPWMSWIDKVRGVEKEAKKVAEELDMFLDAILTEHLNDQNVQREKVKDLVDVLVEVQRHTTPEGPIDRESIKALLLDLFAAGTDTIMTATEWAMSELLRHPRIMKELQEEVRTISEGKARVNEDDIENMRYLKAVIKETFRLHPPIPLLLFRESTEHVKLNGYDITAQTLVITNAWAIQRDPHFWKDPNEFHPERFLASSVDFKGHDFQLIPFGGGRRSCPGIFFASINVELILANLVYAFDWALPGGAKSETLDMDESSGVTVHRRTPLLVVATPYCCN